MRHIAGLLAEAGETVHVVAHRWAGASKACEESVHGRLIIHRIAFDQPVLDRFSPSNADRDPRARRAMTTSTFPAQAFSWQVALLAESLIQAEGIDVIEAQEWEAPLYYLQLRRRLGLGPARHPPCVVHLHSSTEQIFAANAWDTSVLDYAPAASAEAFSIGACDALLSPSRFIAEEAMLRHGIQSSDITVLPYPIGDALPLERSSRVWSGRSICHVGRLEPRKGVIELADAVAAIAVEYPDLRIDFVGGDTPMEVTGGLGVGEAIRNRVPAHVRNQFRFHGSCDAVGVANILAGACAAIVPSRWENFPYSCIESMASGLPVIVSPNGGMRELVSDGVSGWIASEASPPGLAGALRRALASSGPERERMGRAARSAVTRTCDNAEVVRRHLQLKDRLIRKHKGRGTLPLSRASAPAADIVKGRCTGHSDGPANLGVVVSVRGQGERSRLWLRYAPRIFHRTRSASCALRLHTCWQHTFPNPVGK
ncbi:glycosyltransferase family 4 protein [Thermomonas carbonis]|uniref:Glycosyltransferase family 4 protein n=1 Tax=Thermomonas carbonis TaxID=1463158 RepID=A0A7G9SMR7_9GAMM|nr:glycosyltransferase family 4 protein [Thermomonas carbonis]QNN69142.1 glycosyltransferase family 4 protein [Thermomonas carbonis]